MTTHEYLSQVTWMESSIKGQADEVRRLRDVAYSVGGLELNPDKVQSSNSGSRLENAVTKLVDLEREVNAKLLAMIDLDHVIKEQIQSLDDNNGRYREILYGIYVYDRSKSRQAREMGLSFKTVSRIYRQAMRRFEEKYGELYKNKKRFF